MIPDMRTPVKLHTFLSEAVQALRQRARLHHIEFWLFLGRIPLFQLLDALFWPKRRPTILNFYPTRNFGHFWAALSKMSLNFSKFLGRLRRHTQCPLFFVSSSVSSSCLLLWPWLRSLSHGAPCLLHVMLGLAWLPPPMVTGFFEIAEINNKEDTGGQTI